MHVCVSQGLLGSLYLRYNLQYTLDNRFIAYYKTVTIISCSELYALKCFRFCQLKIYYWPNSSEYNVK